MWRFFIPLPLLCCVLFVGGCGLVWKFGYTFPDKLGLEISQPATYAPSSDWTLTRQVGSTSTPATVPAPISPAPSSPSPTTTTQAAECRDLLSLHP